jgi:hypothetical protein
VHRCALAGRSPAIKALLTKWLAMLAEYTNQQGVVKKKHQAEDHPFTTAF